MKRSGKEKLRRFYAQFTSEDHVLIPINADPDAIASAMAVKRLLWRRTAGVVIARINKIERPDNLAMIRLTGAPLVPFEKIDPTRINRIVMVDSQPDHHDIFRKLKPDVIIDHHPLCESTSCAASFTDIRPKYGATATILIEYLRAAKIKPSTKLATGLYYAIKADTSDFERQTLVEDLEAFQFVFRYVNIALARRIEKAEMRREFLSFFKKALADLRIRKGRAFVHLGQVVHPDVCVQIADFMLHIESVNWSVISGIHDKKLAVIFRNDGIRQNAGQVAKMAFGKLGSAGGHKSAARAEIPQEVAEEAAGGRERSVMARWIVRQIEKSTRKVRMSG
jgi:nanoRNase/pAp phosphatase (c-di-AMP/oligoRNAs hydrolase)